jgi:hypothetical protein
MLDTYFTSLAHRTTIWTDMLSLALHYMKSEVRVMRRQLNTAAGCLAGIPHVTNAEGFICTDLHVLFATLSSFSLLTLTCQRLVMSLGLWTPLLYGACSNSQFWRFRLQSEAFEMYDTSAILAPHCQKHVSV